jgi:ATP synthase protein I
MAKTAKGRGADRTRERDRKFPAQDDKRADFDERLERARGNRSDAPEATARGNAMGTAFKISSELVVGLFVGGLIGWQLDKWFDTSPVFLLIFFLLGAAAGIWNVIRVALEMQSNAQDADGASKKPGSEPAGR